MKKIKNIMASVIAGLYMISNTMICYADTGLEEYQSTYSFLGNNEEFPLFNYISSLISKIEESGAGYVHVVWVFGIIVAMCSMVMIFTAMARPKSGRAREESKERLLRVSFYIIGILSVFTIVATLYELRFH